jgi:TRAP-type mannitol/chloroaromatic compound transport system substrate-binding protein
LKRLVAAGTQLRPFTQSVMEARLKASNEVNAETSAVNADYKKVWDSIVAFHNDEYL